VRAFDSDSAPEPPAPMREIRDLDAELILADLDLVERRLERIRKEKSKPQEEQALVAIKAHLDAEKPLRSLTSLDEAAWAQFSGFRFLTLKPLLLVLNVDEGAVAAPPPPEIAAHARAAGLGLVQLSAKVEQDIAQMSPDEQRDFVAAPRPTHPPPH